MPLWENAPIVSSNEPIAKKPLWENAPVVGKPAQTKEKPVSFLDKPDPSIGYQTQTATIDQPPKHDFLKTSDPSGTLEQPPVGTFEKPLTKTQDFLRTVFPTASSNTPDESTGMTVLKGLGDLTTLDSRILGKLAGRGDIKDPDTHHLRDAIQSAKKNPANAPLPAWVLESLTPSLFFSLAGRAGKPASKVISRFGNIAEDVTGLSKKALTSTAFPNVKKKIGGYLRELGIKSNTGNFVNKMNSIAKNEDKITSTLVDKLRNFTRKMPEAKIANEAVKKLPPIKTDEILGAMEKLKKHGPLLEPVKAFNQQVDDLAVQVINFSDDADMISAVNARSLYQQLDDVIGNAYNPDGTIKEGGRRTVEAVKKLRTLISGKLKTSAKAVGRDDYVKALEGMNKKYILLEEAEKVMGTSARTAVQREKATENFLKRLYNPKASPAEKRFADELDRVFGTDFKETAQAWGVVREVGWDPKTGITQTARGGTVGLKAIPEPIGALLDVLDKGRSVAGKVDKYAIQPAKTVADATTAGRVGIRGFQELEKEARKSALNDKIKEF
ncbi:MAG: hypothetical protein DRP42_03785 [Tenericutes bacterium]|nr:MAG: hypothetical protein DRP42_03785 [Mycoplasmatota bacterium]